MPPVSILMPYRDAAATLGESLASIAAQTFADYELVAVDDHSTDGSAELLHRHASRDARIRCLRSPRPGLVAALDHGLRACAGDIVVRMDADDRMRPSRIDAHLRHFAAEPRLTLSATRVRAFPDLAVSDGLREYLRWQNACLTVADMAEEIYVESPLAHPSVAYRRAAVLTAGGYRDGPFPEDYELWLRLHHGGHRMAKIPEVLLDWRDYPERTSRTDPRCARGAFDALRAAYLARDPRLRARAGELVIWGAGRRTRKRCDHLLRRGYRPQAWIDIDPRKIGNRLAGVPVRPPAWLDRVPRPFVLVYVANHGARDDIARDLAALGYRRGRDWLAVG